MSRYPLSLPEQLKHEAERWANNQGVSLNQFILWAVAEKVGALGESLDDPKFPHVTYRRSAHGPPAPVIRGTRIRVQTIAVATQNWKLSPGEIASEYDISEAHVREALAFYEAHRAEIDSNLAMEASMEASHA